MMPLDVHFKTKEQPNTMTQFLPTAVEVTGTPPVVMTNHSGIGYSTCWLNYPILQVFIHVFAP